jgi:rhodanese-related sulfurtransferase
MTDMNQLIATELARWLNDPSRTPPVLLDVREPWEVEKAAMPGITAIPMNEIPGRVGELDAQRDIVAICHHGMRSLQVAHFLARHGFARMHNLSGGIDAWSRTVDAGVPRY